MDTSNQDRRVASFDVVIIGAGLAGASSAVVLGHRGHRVALVDPNLECAPVFKAEKIEPDQADLFRTLRLMDGILPHAVRVHAVQEAHRGRVMRTVPIEQYGVFYQDMVNAVRRQVPARVDQRVARAERIDCVPAVQTVHLSNGESLTTRLVVVSSGTGGKLHDSLNVTRRVVRDRHSLCSGWDVARVDDAPFPFESLTYFADSIRDRIDYITFFPIPGRMRVNLFSYHEPKDPWVRALSDDPRGHLERTMARLSPVGGDWRATSKVENVPIELYVADPPSRDGVVLIGDACQSVCPATGTGLSKVLTDVHQLCVTHLPGWLATEGMSASKIASFYQDSVKTACDRHSLETAEYQRNFGTARSFRWWVQRRKSFLRLALNGWRR